MSSIAAVVGGAAAVAAAGSKPEWNGCCRWMDSAGDAVKATFDRMGTMSRFDVEHTTIAG